MFIIKKNYYFYIDNTKSINLSLLKKNLNITLIYRNNYTNEHINEIIRFRKKLRSRKIKFYIANNLQLAKKCKADGLYISSYNKKIYHNFKFIGSAHNFREINQKIKQKCKTIILSRLFKTYYKNKKNYYGVLKFNLIRQKYKLDIIPLGGIKNSNLMKLNLIGSNGFVILSAIKKKPVITYRLF